MEARFWSTNAADSIIQATRLKVVCIFDAILDASVVACTAWMVRPLKTELSNKFVVVFVFSFRLPYV